MTNIPHGLSRLFLFLFTFTGSLAIFSQPIPPVSGAVASAGGLTTVTFAVPAGKINVYLPSDIRAGDTISGTVSIEPVGKDPKELASNASTLSGMVVDLGDGQRFPANSSGFKWHQPQVLAQNAKSIAKVFELISPNGSHIARAEVPVSTMPGITPSSVQMPKLAQAGRPITITGPFDGDASNTKCSVGGQPLDLIIESPRGAIFRSPTAITGPMNLDLDENGNTASAIVRNVGVALTSPKTNLLKGDKTTVNIRVTGLKGITSTLPLRLVTSGSANMTGGNTQNLEIKPENVAKDGTFSRNFGLTGTMAGGFSVTATVLADNKAGGNEKCKCNCEFAKPPITGDTTRSDGGGTENTFTPNMKRADCTGSKCSLEGISHSWSVGAASTATYTIHAGSDKRGKLIVDVTKAGTLVITVTVTVTCSDGTTCTATATETISVKA
ncbi:MAG: hypothetical protein ABL999_00615 [Pyrinomonadaceae bacterium]